MLEFQSPALEALQREIAARYGFQLDGRTGELHGRCKDCRRTAPLHKRALARSSTWAGPVARFARVRICLVM
jgi:hypothetical protein